MNARYRRRFDMLIRVRQFGMTHGHLFPDGSAAHEAFATLAAEIERLEALAVTEQSASLASRVARKASARQALADTLTRAGFTARVLGKTIPQLEARIRLPLPKDDLALLTVARQFAAGAAPYEARFAALGLPVTELDACISAFETALDQRRTGRADHVQARAEIAVSFRRAMDAVELLDASVANYLRSNAVVLAVWNHDRRYERRRSSRLAGAILDSGRVVSGSGSLWDPLESTCRHASLSIL